MIVRNVLCVFVEYFELCAINENIVEVHSDTTKKDDGKNKIKKKYINNENKENDSTLKWYTEYWEET